MRNLSLIFKKEKKLEFDDIKYFCNDTQQDNDVAHRVSSEHCSYFVTKNNFYKSNYYATSSEQLPLNLDGRKKVVGLECLEMSRELIYAEDTGEVNTFELHGGTDMVTYCEDGLHTMSWSPDQEIVVFITKARNVVVMRRDYNVINESSLDDATFGDQEFITVGWGKKETQFHGSEGKSAAKKKEEIHVPENVNEVDQSISVAWRYDGELFAVSFFGKNGRMFKVFSKDGIVQFTSEKCAGLEGPIAWRPSGLWIAIPQVFPNKYVIALFEKNGLRHRELVLPFKNDVENVIELGWSFDSEVLSVVTLNRETNQSSIYLYTISNYFWYLKQYLSFTTRVVHHKWNFNSTFEGFKPKTLEVVTSDSTWIVYKWDFKVDHTVTFREDDESVVGVIDGNNLLFTNFRGTVVPPPMAGFTLKNDHPINAVGFLRHVNNDSSGDPNRFFVVDSAMNLKFFTCEFIQAGGVKRISGAKMLFEMNKWLPKTIPLSYFQYLWVSDQHFVYAEENKLFLAKINEKVPHELEVMKELCFHNEFVKVNAFKKDMFLVTGEYLVAVYDISGSLVKEFSANIKKVERFSMISTSDSPMFDENSLITFENHGELKIGNHLIAHNVTSYYITERYLTFTTHDALKFYDLFSRKVMSDRKIETGARLVVIVPKSSKTVLQLPRGNLETIEPRILSIKLIGDLIDRIEYSRAYEIIRKQRINLNLLVDHNFERFVENKHTFLKQIDNSNWLCLFLSELQNDDVTRTMYASNYEQCDRKSPTNKINVICQMLCSIMELENPNGFVLPIVTSHVKQRNIERGLQVIWDLKKMEVEQKGSDNDRVDTEKLSTIKSDEALKYLICLVDVNELYNIALGMYDFDLVLFVANKSQKDPKEYLKFLNDIKAIEDGNYQKYKIDVYLKRYEKALINIIQCEEEERFMECLDLVETYNYYSLALSLLPIDSKRYKEVAIIYGNYLRTKGGQECLWQASVMYERGDDLKQAIMSARHVLDWQRCIHLMQKNGATYDEVHDFCVSILPVLVDARLYPDAYKLLSEYLNNLEGAIEICLEGRLFREVNLLSRRLEKSKYDEFFKKSLDAEVNSYHYFIDENVKQFLQYKNRLRIVRDNRNNLPNGGYAVEDYDQNDDASSVNSMSSKRTGSSSSRSGKSTTSSKNRRKMERKLTSLKEGNPYEELALIEALYNLIELLLAEKYKIVEMNVVLMEHCMDSLGRKSQKFYKTVMQTLRDSIDEIFVEDIEFPKFNDLNNYRAAEKARYYQLLKPHLRIKPTFDFSFTEFDALL